MDRLENLVRESLSAHADEAPDSVGLLDAVHDRTTRRRRRVWLATASSAAAVVAVVAGVLIATAGQNERVTPITSPAPSVTTDAETPAGEQIVSYHGVEVFVPASWKINDVRCGTPLHDTVITQAASTLCWVPRPPGLTVVRIVPADTAAGAQLATVATRNVTVHGAPGRQGFGVPPGMAGEIAVLELPGPGVVISVESPDRAKALALLDAAKVVSVDNAGCVAHVGSLTPPRLPVLGSASTSAPTMAGGTDLSALVPGQPASASLCVYDEDWVVTSKVLPADELPSLISILNALPAGVSLPGDTFELASQCADDARRGFIATFTYADGSAVDVYVHIAGRCGALSATNGWRTAKIDTALVDFLVGQTGYTGPIDLPANPTDPPAR